MPAKHTKRILENIRLVLMESMDDWMIGEYTPI